MSFLLQTIAAMLGTFGLAILFHAPAKQWPLCCLVGGIGWLISSTLVYFGLPIVLSTVVATTILTILSRLFSTLREVPVSVFLLTGIFPLVPGVKIYLAANYAFSKNLELFGEAGMEALMQSGAIVMGILMASSIPQGLYDRLSKRPKKVMRRTEGAESQESVKSPESPEPQEPAESPAAPQESPSDREASQEIRVEDNAPTPS